MQAVRVKGVSNPMQFPDDMDIDDIREFLRRRFTQQAVEGNQPLDTGALQATAQAYRPTMQEKFSQGVGSALTSSGLVSDNYQAQNIGKNIGNIAAFSPAGAAFGGDEFGTAAKKGDKVGMALGALEGVGIGGDIAKLAIFGGVLAKSADLGALAKAKKLETGGANRDEIWKETGWANDKGDWKFEIDDSGFTLDPSSPKLGEFGFKTAKGDVIKHGKLKDAYPEMMDNMTVSFEPELKSQGSYRSIGESKILGLPREHFLRLKDPAKAITNTNDKIKSWVGKIEEWTQPGYAEKYAKDYEVPLAEARIDIDEDISILTENIGKAREYKGGIEFYKGTDSTAIHELQHGIQASEGFAEGGNPAMFAGDYNKSLHNKNYNESEATNARLEVRKTPEYKAIQSKIDSLLSKNDMEAVRPLIHQRKAMENAAAKPFDDEVVALAERSKLNPHEQYQRLAGEAEARNVQKRMDWTPEQRRETPPWASLDVPEDELIYRKGGGINQSSVLGGGGVKLTKSPFDLGGEVNDRLSIDGAHIDISESKWSPTKFSIVEFLTDEASRGQGKGGKLLDEAINKYGGELSGAFSSKESLTAAYNRGFRPTASDKKSKSLEQLSSGIKGGESVTMSFKGIDAEKPLGNTANLKGLEDNLVLEEGKYNKGLKLLKRELVNASPERKNQLKAQLRMIKKPLDAARHKLDKARSGG